MAHLEGGYEQLDKRLGDLASSIDSRFAQVDSRFAQIDARFVQIDGRFVQIDGRFAQIDGRFGQVELRLDGLGRRAGRFSVADDVAYSGHRGSRRCLPFLLKHLGAAASVR